MKRLLLLSLLLLAPLVGAQEYAAHVADGVFVWDDSSSYTPQICMDMVSTTTTDCDYHVRLGNTANLLDHYIGPYATSVQWTHTDYTWMSLKNEGTSAVQPLFENGFEVVGPFLGDGGTFDETITYNQPGATSYAWTMNGVNPYFRIEEGTAPGTAAITHIHCYADGTSAGELCCVDDAGTTTCMSDGGSGSPANPTASVGLTAVNGAAATFMRSDAAPPIDQNIAPTWTGVHAFEGDGTGTFGSYDATFGDVTTPDYGGIQIGSTGIYSSSFATGNINLGKTLVFRNEAAVAGILEFAWIEGGNTLRAGIPESGSGNATNFFRSFMIAGPYSAATGDNHFICDTETAFNGNIDCDTSATGADMFIQDDLEVEGTIYAHETINLEGATADGNQVILQVGADPGADVTISLPTSTGTLSVGAHTTDTSANTECTGTTTYLDGEGNCDPFSPTDDTVLLGNGTGWDSKTIPDCNASEQALNYTQATNTWTCQSHPIITDTNANTICTGTDVYLDGEGNCDTISGSLDVKSGTVNITEGSPATITFTTAFSGTPYCTCTLEPGGVDMTCWISTAATTTAVSFDWSNSLGGGAASTAVNWICTDAGDP